MKKRDDKVAGDFALGERGRAGLRKAENLASAIASIQGVDKNEAKTILPDLLRVAPGVMDGSVRLEDGLALLAQTKRYETEAQMGALQEAVGAGASEEAAVRASMDPRLSDQARGTMASDAERAAEITPEKAQEEQFSRAVQLLDRPRLELQTRAAQAIGADLQKDENSPTGFEDPAVAAGRGLSDILQKEIGVRKQAADTAGSLFGELMSEALDPLELVSALKGVKMAGRAVSTAERMFQGAGALSAGLGVTDSIRQLRELKDAGTFFNSDGSVSDEGLAALTQLGISAGFGAASGRGLVAEGVSAAAPKAEGYTVNVGGALQTDRLVRAIQAEQDAAFVGPRQPPTEEQVNAALDESTDDVAVSPEPEAFQKAKVGERVEAPAELDAVVPGKTWVKVDESTYGTTVETAAGPVQLNVRVNEEGLTLTSEELKAGRGLEAIPEGMEAAGLYTPGSRVQLTKTDLIQTLRGTGVATKAHEVLHFLRSNGLISAQDWATMKARYAAKAKAGYAGDWAALPDSSPDPNATTKENLIEEVAADAFGEFAQSRLRFRQSAGPVKAFSKVWEFLHSAGSRLVGGDRAAFDRLLRGQYARENAPAAQPAARPEAQQAVQDPEVDQEMPVASEGELEAVEAQASQATKRAEARESTAEEIAADQRRALRRMSDNTIRTRLKQDPKGPSAKRLRTELARRTAARKRQSAEAEAALKAESKKPAPKAKATKKASLRPRPPSRDGGDFMSNPSKIYDIVERDGAEVVQAFTPSSGMYQKVLVKTSDGRLEDRQYSVFGVRMDRGGRKASVAPVRRALVKDEMGKDVARVFHDEFRQFDTPKARATAASFMRRSRSDQEKLGLKPYVEDGRPIHTWTRVDKDEYGNTFLVQYREDPKTSEPQVVGLLQPYEKGKQKGTVGMALGGKVTGGDNRAMTQLQKILGIHHSELRSEQGESASAKTGIPVGPNESYVVPEAGAELPDSTVSKASLRKKKAAEPADDREDLKRRFMEERAKNKRAAFLSPLTMDELESRDIYLSEDGSVGYTLTKGDKDFGNLFNNSKVKGAGRKAIVQAIKQGARTLDAFDGFLPDLYREYGFVETARLKFDPAQAPAGWESDPDLSKKPDVVFMVYRGGDRATIEDRVGKFPPSPKAKRVRSYDAAKDSQNARLDIVDIRENPPKEKVSLDEAKDQLERQNSDLSGLPRNEQLKIMVKAAVKELQYQIKQRRSGAGWYRGDIRELEHAAKKAFPELADPEQMGIFKALIAATSFGNKPGPNIEQAFQIYDHFRKTGELMGRQRTPSKMGPEGPGQFVIQKHWSGGPAFGYKSDASMAKDSDVGSTEDKLRKLKSVLGSWGAVADFLAGTHTVRELKAMGFENVTGKLNDVVAGGTVLGPKGGPFMQNITGKLGDLTGDMWFARTFNRLRGTKIVDAPRSPSERALMRDFIEAVAKKMGVSPADAQAMLWFSEKDLYGKMAGGEDFGTYSVSGRQALESYRNKSETDELGIAPARKTKVQKEAVISNLGKWAPGSRLNESYDISSLPAEQARQFTEEHAKWVIEEAELETGAKITPSFENGRLTATIDGTSDQSRAAAALVALGLQQESVPFGEGPWDDLSNDWKKYPNGEKYREFLDDVGHSPEGLDEFVARVATNRQESWEAATAPVSKASLRKKPSKPGSFDSLIRSATKPIIKRLREIRSFSGRPIGGFIADQLEARRRAYEMTAGRMISRVNDALAGLDSREWDMVQRALDGEPGFGKSTLDAKGRAAYDEVRAVLNEVKAMAKREGVFSGQGIREYFPHMFAEGTFDEDAAVDAHLEYLLANDPAALERIAAENEAWTGLIGTADNRELAAIDLAKNWNREAFFKTNPHLEKFRSASPRNDYRRDKDVLPRYVLGAVRRIMDARYLGSKSEVIQQGIRSIRDQSDQDYVRKALSEILGGAKSRHFGTALVSELNTLNGLSKLGSAGLAQLTQLVVAGSEMAGASGVRGALVDVAKGAAALVRSRDLLFREAARSGATFAADSGEAMRNFAGTGSNTKAEKFHRAIWRALGLGTKKLEFMVDTTYGVKTLDKFARVMADRFGRETYIRALKSGDRQLLVELLGSPERADAALKEDAPNIAKIEATWRAGGTDPLLNDRATLASGSRLALAGKRFADKTQYRTDTQDQPLLFTNPVLKAANTFYSFAYSHWRWNAEHVQAGREAAKRGDTKTAARHARALVMQHLVTGPLAGASVIMLRSLLTGKGLEEKDEDDITNFAEAWEAAMSLDTIGSEKYWTAHSAVAKWLQGWQYSGGLGYPLSYVERGVRAAKDYDTTRGLMSFAFGSPGEMGIDIGTLAVKAGGYALNPTKANRKAAVRAFYTVLFNHTLPNVGGVSSAVRRKLTATEDRPNKSLGWLGVFDPDAYWTKEHGWTSDAAEEAREEALERRREREEREAEDEDE